MNDLPVSTLVETIAYHARQNPDGVAYTFKSEELTYGRLQDDVRRIAGALSASGLRPGDRCAVLLPTGLDFVRTLFAIQTLGAAPLAIDSELPAAFLTRRLEATGCQRAIVAQRCQGAFGAHDRIRFQSVEELKQMPVRPWQSPQITPDDVAVLAPTSGTSGEHRTAILLQRNMMAFVRRSAADLRITPDDVLVNWVPLYHGLGMKRFLFAGLYFGCPVHLVSPALIHLRLWLETITRLRATITGAADFGFRMAAEIVKPADIDLTSLRYAINTGERIRPATIEQFEQKFGVPGVIRPGYGLSEASGVSLLAAGEPLRIDDSGNLSCGRPIDGLCLQIIDEEGRPQPTGSPGEIRLFGDQVFVGYCDDPAATREKLRDGWLYTGDIGCLDADGHLYVQGRKRSIIKRGGAMIVPRDVEEPAERVPGVLTAAAIGVDRSSLGIEDLILIIEVDSDAADWESRRQRILRDVIAAVLQTRGLTPNDVIVVPRNSIPRTATGKLRHEELKQQYIQGKLTS